MREVRRLSIVGQEYTVITATAEEAPELEAEEGHTRFSRNTILVREGLPTSRDRDTLLHEVSHAFLEATGLGSFIKDNLRPGVDATEFEETLIRLAVPGILRMVDENGQALVAPTALIKRKGAK